MNEFTIITTIGRPAAEVFAAITDIPQMPVWNPGLAQARLDGDGPLAPGATIIATGTFLGRSYTTHQVCTALTANTLFATKTSSGPFYLEMQDTYEPTPDGTRVTTIVRGETRGFFKLAEPLVVRLASKQFQTAYENLRTLLEERALSPHGS